MLSLLAVLRDGRAIRRPSAAKAWSLGLYKSLVRRGADAGVGQQDLRQPLRTVAANSDPIRNLYSLQRGLLSRRGDGGCSALHD
jgi:hypothetical protein